MRRKALSSAAVAATLLLGSATSEMALADPPTLDDSGLVYHVEADVSPPQASSERRRQGVRVDFSYVTGNIRTGERPPSARRLEFRLPKGFKFNHRLVPSCPLTRTWEPSLCPRGSRIGFGSATADARPLVAEFIRVRRVLVFNGRLLNGRPALLLSAKVFGLALVVPFEIKSPQGSFGPRFVFDAGPQPAPEGAFTAELVSVDLAFPKRPRSLRGRRVHLWETATTCRRFWHVQAVVVTYEPRMFVASDRVPCVTSTGGGK
jgi:hypothetical protein